MKKFEFRLNTALRHRETQLEAEQSKLHGLLVDRQCLVAAIRALDDARRESRTFIERDAALGTTEFRAFSAFLVGWESRSRQLAESLSKQDRLIDAQRQLVIQADRNVRLLMKLQEKQLGEWQQQMDRHLENAAQEAWTSAQHQRNLAP